MQWRFHGFEFDTDPGRIDMDRVFGYLSTTYWSANRSFEEVSVAWKNSQVVFGIYGPVPDTQQVGFARVVTDTRTIGWLADVFVDPQYRKNGLGKFLVERITEHPACADLRLFILGTRDAHGLYAQYGWAPPLYPERFMVRMAEAR